MPRPKITVCFIENVDAMGVHTGDSFCTAPMLTIDPELQERLQKHSYDIVEAIEVIGGTNIQFAHDPRTGRVVVIEITTLPDSALGQGDRISHCLVSRCWRWTFSMKSHTGAKEHSKIHSLGRLCRHQVRAVGL
jgi:hypothetical protein